MPIITIQFIKDVVANDAQKQELLVKMTDTFISVVGEVARPFVYCIIQETPQMEWSIGGKAMPDLAFLIGPEYTAQTRQVERDHDRLRRVVEGRARRGRRRSRARTTWPRRCGRHALADVTSS